MVTGGQSAVALGIVGNDCLQGRLLDKVSSELGINRLNLLIAGFFYCKIRTKYLEGLNYGYRNKKADLRPFLESDAEDLYEYLKEPAVNCFACMKLNSVEEAKEELKKRSQRYSFF